MAEADLGLYLGLILSLGSAAILLFFPETKQRELEDIR
jgi:hypothetical protein